MTVLVERATRLRVRLVELGVPAESAPRLASELVRDGWVCFGADRTGSTSPCPCDCLSCSGHPNVDTLACRHPGVDCAEAAG